jgi:hypothetical protein
MPLASGIRTGKLSRDSSFSQATIATSIATQFDVETFSGVDYEAALTQPLRDPRLGC